MIPQAIIATGSPFVTLTVEIVTSSAIAVIDHQCSPMVLGNETRKLCTRGPLMLDNPQ